MQKKCTFRKYEYTYTHFGFGDPQSAHDSLPDSVKKLASLRFTPDEEYHIATKPNYLVISEHLEFVLIKYFWKEKQTLIKYGILKVDDKFKRTIRRCIFI